MATDATGAPTPLGIPKYNTSADAPSGLGFNAAMDALDALIASRVNKPAGVVSGDVPVWNGTTFARPTGTPDATKYLRGDGAWVNPTAPSVWMLSSSGQSIPTAVWTLMSGATYTENVDTDNMHDPVTNPQRVTFKTAGLYHVVLRGSFDAGTRPAPAGTGLGVRARTNGATATPVNAQTLIGSTQLNSTGVYVDYLYQAAANDFVEVEVFNNDSAAMNVSMAIIATRVGS